LVEAKAARMSPKVFAEKVVAAFTAVQPDFISAVSIAGPGFINFTVKDEAFARTVTASQTIATGSKADSAKKPLIMVEYTDPNPFKVFHIGHLMANAIGESLSRLVEHGGAQVKRANWQ